MIIDGVCIAIIYRLGYGDQMKKFEYHPDDSGVYFDNEGFDKTKFQNMQDVERTMMARYPGIKVRKV
jgi:hypothetical protein